ncbi:TetR/AcrR family transcriptional regulator [Amycolatopsis cynarae]|uniref:TetR/AcrR family transcriptional regulator n=1 Tax=Amycolatopsis cynarae TaxID=2995223 RepID=A0ABY7AUI7_9PSEU|nr:TetR/AcrR family transcriptional regulator [Amycolatopsis sp. HUAS 11-8]WAL63183.1 TetR/AcrR family transcriptional regulator [Amycolatopsis sp. HUAS 11-8]
MDTTPEAPSAPLRTYGGVAGEDRQAGRRAQLVEAGLNLLGAADGPQEFTVRGVCREAGLAARYFYENFADRDALAIAVHDHVVTDIATSTLAAVRATPGDARARTQAGLRNLVRKIAEDPRRGRLLFSPALGHTVLAQRRVESTRWFVHLLGLQAREFYGLGESTRVELIAQMLVGGLAQALTSWLDGTLRVDEAGLVELATEIFVKVADLV